jgi:ATP-dependent helicase HepA
MVGFFVYHSAFKIGQIVSQKNRDVEVRFLAPGQEQTRRFQDPFDEGVLKRWLLPLGTACEHNGELYRVERVMTPQIPRREPATYEVRRESDGLRKVVEETKLTPSTVQRHDGQTHLAGLQQQSYRLFHSRERLADAHAEAFRQAGGLSCLLASRIDPRPHQAFVAGAVLFDNRKRYILADEVGLGKTIEAGLVIRDLLGGKPDARVLVLCPAALTQQWLCELYSKFVSRPFTMLEMHDPATLSEANSRTVISPFHDAAGSAGKWLLGRPWDLVVIDECHHLLASAALYGLTRQLSRKTPWLLLLSALPAQQRRDEYLRLLALLEPQRYGDALPDDFDARYEAQPVIGRRLRMLSRRLSESEPDRGEIVELARCLAGLPGLDSPAMRERAEALAQGDDVVERGRQFLRDAADHGRINRRILRNRRSRLIELGELEPVERRYLPTTYEPGQAELEAMQAVCDLLRQARGVMRDDDWSAFARVMAQSLASAETAQDLADRLAAGRTAAGAAPSMAHLAGSRDWPRLRDGLLAAARPALGPEVIADAAEACRRWERSGLDGRFDALLALLDEGEGKLVVFAGYAGLAKHLADRLAMHHDVAEFRGELSREEKEKNVQRFRDDPSVRILVCDETGGEGRNFQFADALVHYDLPWHVSRVEQRIGRLDRIGRAGRPVPSRVLFARDTPEADLARCLAEGFEVFSRSVSGLEFALRDLEAGLVRSLLGAGSVEEALEELRQRVPHERSRDESDAALDEASFDAEAAARYRRGQGLTAAEEDVEAAFLGYVRLTSDGAFRPAPAVYPAGTWMIDSERFREVIVNLPGAPRDGRGRVCWTGTFRRDVAQERLGLDFFTAGHPLYDAVINSLSAQPTGRSYAIEVDAPASAPFQGYEFVVRAIPDLSRLADAPALADRTRALLPAFRVHHFVDADGKPSPDQDALLALRKSIDPEDKGASWWNLTKEKARRLGEVFPDWYARTQQAAEAALSGLLARFETEAGPRLRAALDRLGEQIRQEGDSEEGRELARVKVALEGWRLVIDTAGFLSVNGGLARKK